MMLPSISITKEVMDDNLHTYRATCIWDGELVSTREAYPLDYMNRFGDEFEKYVYKSVAHQLVDELLRRLLTSTA